MTAYKPRDLGTLKGAVTALIEAVGGLARAAELSRVGVSTLCRYSDPECRDFHMPIDIVLALEARAADQPVTRYLAASAGAVLIATEAKAGDLAHDFARTTKDAASAFSHYAETLRQGGMSAAKRQALLADLDRLTGDAAAFRADLMRMGP